MPIIESVMGIQVIGNNGENIIKSPIVEAYIGSSLMDSTEVASDTPTDISTKVEQLMAAKHTHANKETLDKFAESDGKPIYDGKEIGGAGDFIIKMTVTSDDNGNYTVTSCDATVEQIDAAVAAEKRVVLVVSFEGTIELPMIQGVQGRFYSFGAFFNSLLFGATVAKDPESGADDWQFYLVPLTADFVDYSNDALPDIYSVKHALDVLVSNSHTHTNKDTLDKLSESDGKLQYNGSDVGLKGDKGDTPVKGTDYWTAADKTEIVNDVLAALPTWTGGSY